MPHTHHSTVYFQFIVFYCAYTSTCRYILSLLATVTFLHFRSRRSIRFLIDSDIRCLCASARVYAVPCVWEWLVMPLRNRNFNAKSTQKKYLRKPMFNIRNLYSPFQCRAKIKWHCECECVHLWWANEFTMLAHNTQYLRTSLFTFKFFFVIFKFALTHGRSAGENLSIVRFRQINNLFRPANISAWFIN